VTPFDLDKLIEAFPLPWRCIESKMRPGQIIDVLAANGRTVIGIEHSDLLRLLAAAPAMHRAITDTGHRDDCTHYTIGG